MKSKNKRQSQGLSRTAWWALLFATGLTIAGLLVLSSIVNPILQNEPTHPLQLEGWIKTNPIGIRMASGEHTTATTPDTMLRAESIPGSLYTCYPLDMFMIQQSSLELYWQQEMTAPPRFMLSFFRPNGERGHALVTNCHSSGKMGVLWNPCDTGWTDPFNMVETPPC